MPMPHNKELQSEIYKFIVDFKLTNNGISPNYDEIANAVDCSKSTVYYNIQFLKRAKKISLYGRRNGRNIMVPELHMCFVKGDQS